MVPVPVTDKKLTVTSSGTRAVYFGGDPVLIGERINPAGKEKLKEALRAGDMSYLLNEGLRQQEKGVQVLDINVSVPGLEETAVLPEVVSELQNVVNLPLQIDTPDASAMEKALRCYNGKAVVNSVNGRADSMAAIFPLVKKYGGVIIALTLDEKGIPETAEGRVAVARKILRTAGQYGIGKKDIIFDPLVMAAGSAPDAADVTLAAVEVIEKDLNCRTLLGISNVSHGLPRREVVNAAFLTIALERGLSAAIINPFSDAVNQTYRAYRMLHGRDEGCAEYIRFAADNKESTDGDSALQRALCKGLTKQAAALTEQMLKSTSPMKLVESEIIPALDRMGRGFEEKRVYLPQLMMSAAAAKSALVKIRASMKIPAVSQDGCIVVLASVRGDIHDIGKNIVSLLLENYGFQVEDLGYDIPPEKIAEAVIKDRVPLVGLSALMTTTLPAVKETVYLLRERAPWCRIVVGGAALTQEYAASIGADFYAKNAMETVHYARTVGEYSI